MAKKISKIDIVDVDIFKSIGESAEKTQTKVDVLKSALEAYNEVLKQTQKQAGKIKSGLLSTDVSQQKALNKEVQTANTLIEKNANVTANKARVTKALTVEEAKLKEELRKTNLEARQTARLQLAQEGSVEKLRAKLIILTREWDKLTDAERKNSDRGARLKKGIDETTASVTKLEVATGRHQRKVDNYGSALDGLKGKFRSLVGVASQFGVALGGVAILRSGISTVVEFDQAIADLSAITGAGGKDLQFFKDQAIELGKTTKGGASAVVEAYKLIGSAKPELLENADALNQVTEAAITLAKASGLDLPDAATRLTDAMNQFGAPAEKAGHFIDVLANGAKFGAAEIPQITDALLKFGAVAKTSNVSIEESTALIEALAEKGLKGAEAGTGLRNVMLKLSAPDALPKEAKDMLDKLGISFDKLKDTSLPFSERLKELKPLLTDNAALVKTFGTENAVVATTLLSNIDRVDELTVSMGNLGTAQEQADIRSKTLGEAFSNLGNSWNSFILSLTNGERSTDGFRRFIDFLSNNLPKILGYLYELGKVFLIYKIRLIAINVANKLFGDGTEANNRSLKNLTKNLKEGAKASTGLGSALKGIGWAAVIALAFQFVKALYDVASGTAEVRRQEDLLAKAREVSEGSVAKVLAPIEAQIKAERQKLELQLANGKLKGGQLEFEQKLKVLEEKKQKRLEAERKLRQQQQVDLKNANKELEKQKESRTVNRADFSMSESGANSYANAVDRVNSANAETNRLIQKNLDLITYKEEAEKAFTDAISATSDVVHDYTVRIADNTGALDANGISTNNTAGSVEHLTEVIKFQSEAIEEQNRIISEGADDVAERLMRINDLEDERRINIAEIGVLNAEIGGDEEEIIKAKINLIEEELAVRTALMREGTVERVKLEKQAELDIKNLRQTNNKTNYDEQKKWLQLSEKLLTDNLDKKIALLDKEIDARKTHADELRKLADDGNIKASESIAEEERLANEALIKKEKLEKRKQQIAMVSAFLQSYLAAIEAGEKPAQAIVTAGSDKAVIESFINTMPAFIDGTNTTVADSLGAPMMSGEDGYAIRVDGREKILNPELSGMTGNMTTGQIAKLSQDYLNGKLVSKMDGAQQTGGSYMDSNAIIKSIQGLEQTIKNKPEIEYNLEEVVQGLYSFTRKETKGNTVIYNKYRVKG
jgi:TP901 family phage tail tape measure protein